MKTFASILLVFFTVLLLLIELLAITIRFQLLSPTFWQATFEKHNTYSNLTTVLKKYLEDQVVNEGGQRTDIKVLTDFVTTENVKDFVNKNLTNLLNYANDKTKVLNVYFALSRVPKNLLPVTFRTLPDEMPVGDIISKFNIQGGALGFVQNIPLIGRGATLLLVLDTSLVVLSALLLFLLTESGRRFVGAGIAFVISGILVTALFQIGTQIKTAMASDLVQKKELAQVLIGTLAPPLMSEVLKAWLVIGLAFVTIGVVLLFLKKK